ncbi:Uncharacterized protein NEOC95_001830 [Neochlamydia sp. AcF95]|nr:Uncharacterized protein [Neochlamydia sp. AcF95]
MIMINDERFTHNLQRWSVLNQDAAEKIKVLECQEIALIANEDGEWNLQKISEDEPAYLHSPLSPQREAQQWFLSLDLKDTLVVYIYGIGLGYYYEVIKNWLKEDPKRYVVFLENNLEVIKFFLQTERATAFLNDTQAKLFHFSWETSYFSFGFVTSLFSLASFKASALKFYQKNDTLHTVEFQARLSFFHDMRIGISAEFMNLAGEKGFIHNYYQNLMEIPSSKIESKMLDQFKGVPAIICGAGPSLAKNIHLLKELKDKALIMAGGTAMNVLNGAGITPHFGLGIDPNPSHYNRLISNTAFEVPFFYRQRMYNPALKMVHGERLLVAGAGGYRLPAWFENQLGLPEVVPIEEGHNVINFNLSIARELGCNPIIIVGVDLAYSNNSSYAPGLVRHAIQDPKDAFLTKYSHEELLVKDDIYGQPVHTLWKWINESLWFSHFASQYPEITLLNCTEGGIGFTRVPNMTLAEAASIYLKKNYDFSSLVHGEIQNSGVPQGLTTYKVLESLEIFARSLLDCETYCSIIALENSKIHQSVEVGQEVPAHLKNPAIEENLAKLEALDAFKYILTDYKERFLEIFFPRLVYLEYDSQLYSEKEIFLKKIVFEISLYSFLSSVARNNINIISSLLTKVVKESNNPEVTPSKKTLALKEKLQIERTHLSEQEHYSFVDSYLEIIDPELHLNLKKKCEGQAEQQLYANGALKTQHFLHEGKLYGPATYYAENGQLLAQNWYVEGLLEGKGFFYYLTGELYAIKRYRKGVLHGRQEYYFSNGLPKTILPYQDGLMNGEVLLYYASGRIKRQMHFKKGKKDGVERMWNEDAMLLIEAHYENDLPIGTAREWYSNGNLSKEIIYANDSDKLEIKKWNEDGAPHLEDATQGKDYFDLMTNHSTALTTSLHNIYQALVNIAPTIVEVKREDKSTSIEDDLLELQKEMDKLNKYSHEMLKISGTEGKTPKEAVWKTPEAERLVKAQLEGLTKNLSELTCETQASLTGLFEKLNLQKEVELFPN